MNYGVYPPGLKEKNPRLLDCMQWMIQRAFIRHPHDPYRPPPTNQSLAFRLVCAPCRRHKPPPVPRYDIFTIDSHTSSLLFASGRVWSPLIGDNQAVSGSRHQYQLDYVNKGQIRVYDAFVWLPVLLYLPETPSTDRALGASFRRRRQVIYTA